MESNKCDSKCVDNIDPNKIVMPTMPTKDMLEGEIFGDLQESIYNIMVNKTNPDILKVKVSNHALKFLIHYAPLNNEYT